MSILGYLLALLLLSTSLAHAAGNVVGLTCTIRWDPVVHPALARYRLRVSQTSGTFAPKTFATIAAGDTEATCADLLPPVTGDGQYYVVISAVSTAGTESAYAPEVAFVRDATTSTPIASYTFSSTADGSGHGHTLHLAGAAALAQPGIIGNRKFQMPTIGDYAFVDADPDFHVQQWSLAGWVSMTQADVHGCLWAGTGDRYGGVITPQGHAMCYLQGTQSRVETVSPPSVMVLDGLPTHLVCQYDGKTLESWVNGARAGQVASQQALAYTGQEEFYLGRAPGLLGFGCLGSLDEVLVTPSPLTPAQIQALAKGGKLP